MPYTLDDAGLNRSFISDQCWRCRNLLRSDVVRSCRAFPGGIPDAIWDGEFDHRRPFPNDKGIRFDPIKIDEAG